jgi:hypothetical protein
MLGTKSPQERREEHSMSADDFDNLTRALASRAISRRRALQLAAASAIGAAGLGVATREVEARPTCPRRSSCDRRCKNTRKMCSCIRTTEGNKVCVHPCCSNRECNRTSQCERGEVCLKSNCCEGKVCVKRCTEPRPRTCAAVPLGTSSTIWS